MSTETTEQTRALAQPKGLYFEEFAIGDRVESLGRTITETDVVNFASLSGDWNLIHTDAEYSKEQMFGQRVPPFVFQQTDGGSLAPTDWPPSLRASARLVRAERRAGGSPIRMPSPRAAPVARR